MPYIDMRTTQKASLALIKTIVINIAGKGEKNKLARTMQGRIGHQSTPYFKKKM